MLSAIYYPRHPLKIPDTRLHDLRHTRITCMLLKCVPVEIVQVLAGHEKISTTMDYVHLVDKIRARAIAPAYSSAYKKLRNHRRY